MFGYVTINPDALTDAEKARFREVYCGVCASLRRACGRVGQMTLSYDCAFLALLLNALYEPEEQKGARRCAVRAGSLRAYAVSEMTEYAADINALLAYHRALDAWQDDKNRVQLAVSRALKGRVNRVSQKYPQKAGAFQAELARLNEIERARGEDIDAAAGCFGRLLGAAFAPRDDQWAPGLTRMGCALGRFIYVLDAWDDAEKDEKQGAYNPLLSLRAEADYEARVYGILTMEIAACAMEFEKLPIVQDVNLLRNVIYSGVWTKYSQKKEARERKGKSK